MIQEASIQDTPVANFDNAAELSRAISSEVIAQLPAEKVEAEKAMIRTAQELQARGSDRVDGRGQAIGSIPPRIYMRWAQLLPGCWQDKTFVDEFLSDNPQCCAVGYKPKPNSVRHGFRMGASFYHKNKAEVIKTIREQA